MMTGSHEGEQLGACTDCRRFWAQFRAGEKSEAEINRIESRLATTAGTCPVMGTASTMACIVETLGFMIPGTAAIPAVHADRLRASEATGELAVRLASDGLTPDQLLTDESIENTLRVLLAIGGSTNAIIHLTAIAGRAGKEVSLKTLNQLSDTTPLLVLNCLDISGQTLGERLEREDAYVDHQVIRPFTEPVEPNGGLVALFGSLAPQGAILKRSAADSSLFEKKSRAFVFNSLEDLSSRIDDPELDVRPDDFLVLQNAGPRSGTGMPESGYLPIPVKLSRAGVKDMVRISDARMSGTAFGTIILHVTPEAAVGGPLGLVRTGDMIELSVSERRLDLHVPENELQKRRNEIKDFPELKEKNSERGYAWLYQNHVLQANQGCDFDFLKAK